MLTSVLDRGPGKVFFRGLFLCMTIFLGGCTTAPLLTSPDRTALQEDFVRVVTGREFATNDIRAVLTRRRIDRPVTWYMNAPADWRNYVQHLLLPQISAATGLEFSASKQVKASLIIDVSDRSFRCGAACEKVLSVLTRRQAARLQSKDCFFVSNVNADKEIGFSYIFIRRGQDSGGIRHCLHEEFAQSLGLPGDTSRLQDSIFRDGSPVAVLSKHDLLYLQWLYLDTLRPGMTGPEILQAFRRL